MGVPEIKSVRELARTRFFRIEALELRFGNGVERTYTPEELLQALRKRQIPIAPRKSPAARR